MARRINIAIDRGGTFTDCIGNPGSDNPEDDVVIKLLSVDPKNYRDAPQEGIRRILEIFRGHPIPRGEVIDISDVESIRMGTTLATNCVLERTGERCALITTKGFKDALLIGDQTRPKIFDLAIEKPHMLYDIVVEIDERVCIGRFSQNSDDVLNYSGAEVGKSGEPIEVLRVPSVEEIRSILSTLYGAGIRSLAVALVHSYTFPTHEEVIGDIAKELGFTHVSLSSTVSPIIKFVPRANSAVVDAYLTPVIRSYADSINSGIRNNTHTRIQFMQSDGGLVDAHKFSGLKAILSGPAGGVVGYSRTCSNSSKTPLIGFDMGGTSTDVSRFGGDSLEHIFSTTIDGVSIQSPQLNITTVAAGGSSRLFWENGLFRVGPESAGADPGPAAYRKGGPLTISDANIILGRLIPDFFPNVFGPNEDEPLDIETTYTKFAELTARINMDTSGNMSVDDVAYGFVRVANESMERQIRMLTESKGHIISKHRLVTFGGAGGQHAVAVAESLGIEVVIAHRYSSVLSAYGMMLADVVEDVREPCSLILNEDNLKSQVRKRFEELSEKALERLVQQGILESKVRYERFLNLRYEGTECSLMVLQKDADNWDFNSQFVSLHNYEFGFLLPDREIVIDDVRVRAIGTLNTRKLQSPDEELAQLKKRLVVPDKESSFFKSVYFDTKRHQTPVFRLDRLPLGSVVPGPAILADDTQTNVIPPHAEATILKSHIFIKVKLTRDMDTMDDVQEVNPVMLSIFANRFMDIAEQMGTQLRKTSVSTNVKERLDFSCALFDAEGNLVANAPHVPVHLGSMSTCISKQAEIWRGKLRPGSVIITNHPEAGGTHLPDITVISPSFSAAGELLFYVASRAHHADVGGVIPGSIPPDSKELYEEGAIIYSELIVENGEFNEPLLRKLLFEEPARYPNCSGSRKLADNINDIKAQIAANSKGIQLLSSFIHEFGQRTVLKYMVAIQNNALSTVKKMLKKLTEHTGQSVFSHEDYMDDGSVIKLRVTLDTVEEKYIFDFSGTSPQTYGNINAPEAITYSAILYSLRCLVDEEIPLNQGCIKPITVIIPPNSLLSPSKGAAVVGGNVMTSQRITDVILKAFGVMADSQGDCNNFTFGTGGVDSKTGKFTKGFGYYETICGGHGAGGDSWRGPGWHGADAVHTNMTNTKMTDVEILERRYPVLLREFTIRRGSGGKGKYSGGDGVTRDIEFKAPCQASILSERRVNSPKGLMGGEDGARGMNLWVRKERKTVINIGGKNTMFMKPGDRIIINTPGGGGYGAPCNKE